MTMFEKFLKVLPFCDSQYFISDCRSTAINCRMGVKTLPESKCPELLANYCDMLLRKTALSKKLTSEEVERKLREVVSAVY